MSSPHCAASNSRYLENSVTHWSWDRVAESSHALDPEGRYCYVAEQGLVAVSLEDPRPSYPGSELLAIHAGRLDSADTRRVAKQLLREALQILLGPRPLASRELFRTR